MPRIITIKSTQCRRRLLTILGLGSDPTQGSTAEAHLRPEVYLAGMFASPSYPLPFCLSGPFPLLAFTSRPYPNVRRRKLRRTPFTLHFLQRQRNVTSSSVLRLLDFLQGVRSNRVSSHTPQRSRKLTLKRFQVTLKIRYLI